jgi:hypothetical protein
MNERGESGPTETATPEERAAMLAEAGRMVRERPVITVGLEFCDERFGILDRGADREPGQARYLLLDPQDTYLDRDGDSVYRLAGIAIRRLLKRHDEESLP